MWAARAAAVVAFACGSAAVGSGGTGASQQRAASWAQSWQPRDGQARFGVRALDQRVAERDAFSGKRAKIEMVGKAALRLLGRDHFEELLLPRRRAPWPPRAAAAPRAHACIRYAGRFARCTAAHVFSGA
jgi:hypothetical protein